MNDVKIDRCRHLNWAAVAVMILHCDGMNERHCVCDMNDNRPNSCWHFPNSRHRSMLDVPHNCGDDLYVLTLLIFVILNLMPAMLHANVVATTTLTMDDDVLLAMELENLLLLFLGWKWNVISNCLLPFADGCGGIGYG